MSRLFVIVVLSLCLFGGMTYSQSHREQDVIVADTSNQTTTTTAAPAPPPPEDTICQFNIAASNMTLSKTIKYPQGYCTAMGDILRSEIRNRVWEEISIMVSSLKNGGSLDVNVANRTFECVITVIDRNLSLPRMFSENECLHWQIHVNFLAQEAAYGYIIRTRRVLGLPLDDGEKKDEVPAPSTCAFGSYYPVQIKHWSEVDCGVGQRLFSRCQSKENKKNGYESAPACFMDAFTDVESRFVPEDKKDEA